MSRPWRCRREQLQIPRSVHSQVEERARLYGIISPTKFRQSSIVWMLRSARASAASPSRAKTQWIRYHAPHEFLQVVVVEVLKLFLDLYLMLSPQDVSQHIDVHLF